MQTADSAPPRPHGEAPGAGRAGRGARATAAQLHGATASRWAGAANKAYTYRPYTLVCHRRGRPGRGQAGAEDGEDPEGLRDASNPLDPMLRI